MVVEARCNNNICCNWNVGWYRGEGTTLYYNYLIWRTATVFIGVVVDCSDCSSLFLLYHTFVFFLLLYSQFPTHISAFTKVLIISHFRWTMAISVAKSYVTVKYF